MSLPIRLSAQATLDLIDGYNWYEHLRTGLGRDFALCVEASFEQLAANPFISQVRYFDVRIKSIDRFPYGIHYVIAPSSLDVIGIIHFSRNPNTWTDRLPE